MKYRQRPLPAKKRIALVAHDNCKSDLIWWCKNNYALLVQHSLTATGTTGQKIHTATKLEITPFLSGPLGGDQQIGAHIAEGKIDMLIFFWDPFEAQPHDPDVKALLRVAAVWNIPVACNPCTADYIIRSPLLAIENKRQVPDCDAYLAGR